MSDQLQAITKGLAEEFGAVAEAMVGKAVETSAFTDHLDAGWVVTATVEGPLAGTWTFGFAKDEAAKLAGRVLMSDSASEAEIADALVEIAGQMVAALVTKKSIPGLAAKVGSAKVGTALPGKDAGGFACKFDDELTVHVACAFDGTIAPVAAPAPSAPARSSAAAPARPSDPKSPENLELILDIDMPLSVRFGEASMTLDALSRLGPGSLVELSRQPDDPVDVLINGRLVARAEVVVVGGNYGVRIVEVVSAAERIRTINA